MYERSAIVLERYFAKLLGFNEVNNLKICYAKYCELFEKFNVFQAANAEEFEVLSEFQTVENNIEEIQSEAEKLYKKNAKLDYNRDLLFNDITQNPEEIQKCIIKIENDIEKNHNSLKSLREKFIEAIINYNEKKSQLSKCKKNRKNAETEYNESFNEVKGILENIDQQYVELAQVFATEENQEALISEMIDNGKDEKIPFNNFVITNAAKLGFDIFSKEIECYVEAYSKAKKLIDELLEGAVSLELHEKIIKNNNVKLNFLNSEKEYLVQFLDYERITVIHGKRTHRTLMIDACEKFETDINQINNLYQLLLKEISNKSTKKAYKELYNKSYLVDIEEKEANFKKEKIKMNLPVGTIMNSNYWRIEGIKNIYTVFYKDISEVFGKDLDEFDIPKEVENEPEVIETIVENEQPEKIAEVVAEVMENKAEIEPIIEVSEIVEDNILEVVEEIAPANIEESIPEKVESIVTLKTSKKKAKTKKSKRYTKKISVEMNTEESIESEQENKNVAFESMQDNLLKEQKEINGEIESNEEKLVAFEKKYNKEKTEEIAEFSLFDKVNEDDEMFDEKYQDIEKHLAELDKLDSLSIDDLIENTPYESDDIEFEEESIFSNLENEDYEELLLKKKSKGKTNKIGLFSKMAKLNSKVKKKANA